MKRAIIFLIILLNVSFVAAELSAGIYSELNGSLNLQFWISKDFKEGAYPGNVNLKIVNDLGETVFSESFDIKESDFHEITTEYDKFIGVEKSLSTDEIKKSRGTSTGTIFLEFSGGIGDAKSQSYIYNLPKMSQEEMQEISTSEYQKTSVPVSIIAEGIPGLKITLTGYGTYTDYDFQVTKKTRVDMLIENTAQSKSSFSLYGSSFIDETGKQYAYSFRTPSSYIELFPGEKKEAFVLFDDVGTMKTLFLGTDLVFDIGEKTAYTMDELSEKRFIQGAKESGMKKSIADKIDVVLVRYGPAEYEGKKVMRFDIEVTNDGAASINYYHESALMTDEGISIQPMLVYKSTFPGAFEDGDIQPGVTKKGSIFFDIKEVGLKELLMSSAQKISGGAPTLGDAEQIAGTDDYWFRFSLDGKDAKKADKKEGSSPKIEWDFIGVAGLIITLITIVVGWWASKIHRKHTIGYIDKMDEIYHNYNTQQGVCLERMVTLKKELEADFKNGKIDEQDFQLVFQKIDDYIEKLSGKGG